MGTHIASDISTKSGKSGERPAEPRLLRATFTRAGTLCKATLSPGAAALKENLFLTSMLLIQEGTALLSPEEPVFHSRLLLQGWGPGSYKFYSDSKSYIYLMHRVPFFLPMFVQISTHFCFML